ncbi:MAG: hypothetical protein ABI893_01205 [Polaromonas sp.]|uniref:hypothetical protein n=1 Tax=Polaromonas sp. TaxID=1869339 RepID=UPI003262F82A
MKQHLTRMSLALAALTGVLVLAACAGGGLSSTARYRCEQGMEFNVKFVDDTAILDAASGSSLLFRDAGGQGAQQTVYSNPQMRAEFGLGANGREAMLRYPLLPLTTRCVRD